MASYIGSDQELLCPICASLYNTPRKLPGCVHSFCEKCIVTLLQNLKRDEKLGEEFECPVCRLPSKSPENDTTDISKWVQELDIDKELQTKVGKQNEQDAKWCSQCRYVEKFIKSEVYCSTCQESYCKNCSEILHSFKLQRDHAIIDIKDDGENEAINEQAVQLLQTFLTCSTHPDKRVEFFCNDDESFCCATCITSGHQCCKYISELKDLTQKDDNDPIQLSGSFSKLTDHIRSFINLIKEKDAEIKKTPQKLAFEFQEIKERVIRLLDAVEEQIAQDSKALTKAISVKSFDEIELLNSIMSEIDVVTYMLETLVPKLPNASAMVCSKNAKVMLHDLEKKILERCSSFEMDELQLKVGEDLKSIINVGPNETEQIASIGSTARSCPLPRLDEKFLFREGKVEVVGVKHNCISAISPGYNPKYNSISILPDNSLVLTDSYYGICLLVDANSQVADSINFGVKAVTEKANVVQNFIHSACLASGLIAISVLLENKICFVTASNGKLDKNSELNCKYTPTALHGLRSGDLCVLWNEPQAFGIISVCGGSYEDKVYFANDTGGKLIKHNKRMVIDEDRCHMICSYRINSSETGKTAIVASYDFNGNQIFERSFSEIKDPRGIGLDADGNIYLCNLDLGGIHVLSPEGLHIRMIKEGCPRWPLGIGFNKSMNSFAVTQSNPDCRQVVMFSILPP